MWHMLNKVILNYFLNSFIEQIRMSSLNFLHLLLYKTHTMLGSKFLREEFNTRSSISEIQVWPWIDIIMEEFWHCCLIYPFKLYIISISRNLRVSWAKCSSQFSLVSHLIRAHSGSCPFQGLWATLGQAWDLLDGVGEGALWLGQSSSQWNHSSMPRVQGWECHILVLNHLALLWAPFLALFCF